jgi:hypothetical protein
MSRRRPSLILVIDDETEQIAGITEEQAARGMALGIPFQELEEVLRCQKNGTINFGVDDYLTAYAESEEDFESEVEEKPKKGKLSSPDSKSGRLQRACLERMKQHERDGSLPTNAQSAGGQC